MNKIIYLLSFIIVILIGASFRFYHLNWDDGHNLHPDERFLTMVQTAMTPPGSLSEYLDPDTSTFHARNIGHRFFVYGTFPLVVNKTIARMMGNDNYHDLALQGRHLSAMADVFTLIFVMLLTLIVASYLKLSPYVSIWSGLVYALMVLPIQLSHFFTTDTFKNLFVIMALFFASKAYVSRYAVWVIPASISFGLALASKVSALFILPLILAIIVLSVFHQSFKFRQLLSPEYLLHAIGLIVLFVLFFYPAIRLAEPYYFASSSWIDMRINPQMVDNIRELRSWENPDVWFPPSIQWINTPPIWFALKNMAVWGMGLPIFLIGVAGMFWSFRFITQKKTGWVYLLLVIGWMIVFFAYQSVQFTKALRYFINLYPLMAIVSGIAVAQLLEGLRIRNLWVKGGLIGIMLMILVFWPLSFMSIYIQPHTRVQASEWIYQNLPPSDRVVNEHWDDPLPLRLPQYSHLQFKGEMLPVFAEDTADKWEDIYQLLDGADYYFISSNRAWGSVTQVPDRYPKQSQFYEDLFDEKLEFTKVAEFTSYPSLKWLGIPIEFNSDNADETFTVYDHPKVMIFVRRGIEP